jgi:hypothetical protein
MINRSWIISLILSFDSYSIPIRILHFVFEEKEEAKRRRGEERKDEGEEENSLITINNPHISPNTRQSTWPITQNIPSNRILQNNLGFLEW